MVPTLQHLQSGVLLRLKHSQHLRRVSQYFKTHLETLKGKNVSIGHSHFDGALRPVRWGNSSSRIVFRIATIAMHLKSSWSDVRRGAEDKLRMVRMMQHPNQGFWDKCRFGHTRDILEKYPGPSEPQVAEIQSSVMFRDQKDYVRDVAVLISAMTRKGQRRQVEELITNLTAGGCDASVVLRLFGNVPNSVSILNAGWEGLLQN